MIRLNNKVWNSIFYRKCVGISAEKSSENSQTKAINCFLSSEMVQSCAKTQFDRNG